MNKTFIMLFVILTTTISENAYAYIDPASGNAIVSFFIAIFGSAIFFIKSVFYKIFSRSSPVINKNIDIKSEHFLPVIFSEGKTYWTTFRPIVKALIDHQIHFRYVTLDVLDPGLEIDSIYMHSKKYSRNRLGFAKIANIASPVMLSTTPNIGSEGYPLNRPLQVKNLVHVFHAMVDLSCYRKGSLDFYDSVLMTGPHEKSAIRMVEKARKLKEKSLIVAGLPCLDDLNQQKKEIELTIDLPKTPKKTILVAPSWGAKGCFSEYGIEFIKTLASANYHVIIRLHPHSYIFEPESIEEWVSQTKDLGNVTWDNNTFGTKAMLQADIMISDASSIRFDFAFLYAKPVITLPISEQSLSIFESDNMTETWADKMSNKIGTIVNAENIHTIDKIIEETISNFTSKKMGELRNLYVANFGKSSVAIVEYLKQQTELLSMTSGERLLKEQLDKLKIEVTDLTKQLNFTQTDTLKDL